VFARANSELANANDAFKALPGHERQFVPRSEFLHKEIQPLLDDMIFLGSAYDDLFDRSEPVNEFETPGGLSLLTNVL
jgi:hypothetical protein